eukprot:3972490-Alexandrium_andersonii.AAC.1
MAVCMKAFDASKVEAPSHSTPHETNLQQPSANEDKVPARASASSCALASSGNLSTKRPHDLPSLACKLPAETSLIWPANTSVCALRHW